MIPNHKNTLQGLTFYIIFLCTYMHKNNNMIIQNQNLYFWWLYPFISQTPPYQPDSSVFDNIVIFLATK